MGPLNPLKRDEVGKGGTVAACMRAGAYTSERERARAAHVQRGYLCEWGSVYTLFSSASWVNGS